MACRGAVFSSSGVGRCWGDNVEETVDTVPALMWITVCRDGRQAGPSSHSRCVPQAGGRAGFREPVVGGPPGLEEQGVAVEEPTDELRFEQINQREDCKNTF